MRKLMARVALRSALAISAVGIVAAVGAFAGDSNRSTPGAPGQSAQVRSAAYGTAETAPAGARVGDAGSEPAASSSYTLRTENGPRAALAARIVTATLLLTGLVLTALGAIGMRGPSLVRRPAPEDDPAAYGRAEAVWVASPGGGVAAPAYAPVSVPRPGGHPRFGPPPT